MKRFVIYVGLPGSGKTTAALGYMRELLDKGINSMRVNQDEIRRTLGWKSWATWDFGGELEKAVGPTKMKMLKEAFEVGIPIVISDDTNLNRKYRDDMVELAKAHGYDFEIRSVETAPDECVRRDALRGDFSVGRKVIEKMAARYFAHVPVPVDYSRFARVIADEMLAPAVICDLDGTLAWNTSGRSPYDQTRVGEDALNPTVRKVLRLGYGAYWQVIYLSGRSNECRQATEDWLMTHQCPRGPLHMRAADDKRPDWIVKGELFDDHVRGKYNVQFVLDDRDQVVKLWRAMGLQCWQVADGNF